MQSKILIASRDNDCRSELLKLLALPDCTFTTVNDETDLLLEILEKDFDIVIYDLEHSKLDGLKVVRILRKTRPKLSLVVISNDPSKELGGKILQEGVVFYGVKPIHPEALKEAVLQCLHH